MRLRAVTAVYDIRREASGDGRTIGQYIEWLNRTLRLPAPFTVFLDPRIDPAPVQLKPEDELIQVPWDDLSATRWSPQVEAICQQRAKFPASEDLAYRLPPYELLMLSKFEFLERAAAAHPGSGTLMWLDAGVSRFTPHDMSELRLRPGVVERLLDGVDLAISARHHLRDYLHGRPAPYFPGRCQTLTIGCTFLVRSGDAGWLRELVSDHVETQWLAKSVWDTEQTALGELILGRKLGASIQDESGYWLSLLAALFEPTTALPASQRWERMPEFWALPTTGRLLEYLRLVLFRAYRAARYRDGRPGIAAVIPRRK